MTVDKITMPHEIKIMIAAVHETRLTFINDIAVYISSKNIILLDIYFKILTVGL